jgi:site-specific DNA-methyltransferase (adenine-specific)
MDLETTLVSDLFSDLDQAASLLKEKRKITYLEALCLAGEGIYTEQVVDDSLRDQLQKLNRSFFHEKMTGEDVRRAFQLAVLKGMKQDPKPGREMTPDTLVLLIGHIVSVLAGSRSFTLLDPAVGTANLLTGILNQSETDQVDAFGADTDDLLIKLAYTSANLQQKEVHLLHQDGLKPIPCDPADFVACDVPVGYYPDQESAKNYALNGINGKAYTHFLFIEQGLNHLKEAGYLVYLIPNSLFTEDKDRLFHDYVKKNAIILALLQLPATLFKDTKNAKSILLMQKKGEGVKVPKQTLLAEMPDFMEKDKMTAFMAQLNDWLAEHSA